MKSPKTCSNHGMEVEEKRKKLTINILFDKQSHFFQYNNKIS